MSFCSSQKPLRGREKKAVLAAVGKAWIALMAKARFCFGGKREQDSSLETTGHQQSSCTASLHETSHKRHAYAVSSPLEIPHFFLPCSFPTFPGFLSKTCVFVPAFRPPRYSQSLLDLVEFLEKEPDDREVLTR